MTRKPTKHFAVAAVEAEMAVDDVTKSTLGNTVTDNPIHTALVNATGNILAQEKHNLEENENMSNASASASANANASANAGSNENESASNMALRLQTELKILQNEVDAIDKQIDALQKLRTDKMLAASMCSHGLAAGGY